MRVTVVAVRLAGVAGKICHGCHAAVEYLAAGVLKLDGDVTDVEVVAKKPVEPHPDAGAFRGRNVCNGHMARQGVGAGTQTPHMQVMYIDDAFDCLHAGTYLQQRDAARRAFEQNIESLAHDADAGPEDQGGDQQRQDRVDPVLPGDQNACASGDHRCR